MNIKILILIGILILTGIGIWFSVQAEKPTQPEIPIEPEKGEKPEIILISVYDNYQVNPELKTAWGFATIIKTPNELILFDTGGSSEIFLGAEISTNLAPFWAIMFLIDSGKELGIKTVTLPFLSKKPSNPPT